MSITQKLLQWQSAHLLTADQVQAIRSYEDAQPSATKFLWRYGLLGLGILTIGIGLLAIVASNWDIIPDSVKISFHILLNIGVAGTLFYLWKNRQAQHWRFEAVLIIKAVLILTLMALLGQILHTQSSLDKVMLTWWCLITPMILLFGRYRISSVLWTGLSLCVLFSNTGLSHQPVVFFGLLIAFAQLNVLLPLFAFWRNTKPGWCDVGQKSSLQIIVVATNVMLIAPMGYWHAAHYMDSTYRYFYSHAGHAHDYLTLSSWEIALALNILLAYIVTAIYAQTCSQPRLAIKKNIPIRIIFSHLMLALFLSFVPSWFGWFLIYWFVVGCIGLRHDNRRMVGLAITFLAMRIIALYFDLTQSLMTTGILMIVSGLGVLYLVKTYPQWRAAILSMTKDAR